MRNLLRITRSTRASKRNTSRIRSSVRVEQLEHRELLSGGPSDVIKLDFGTANSPRMPGWAPSPVMSGWIGVPSVFYSPDRGHGWEGPYLPHGLDYPRPGADALTRDFHVGVDNTFLVDLAPGTYDVSPSLGMESLPFTGLDIWAEGQPVLINLKSEYGQQVKPTFRVDVTDGQLDLKFVSSTGLTWISDLQIARVATANPTEPLSASAGGSYTAVEGSPIILTASAFGGTGELSYAWDLTGDGIFETPGREVSHAYPDDGEYTAMLRVTDSLGQIALATALISVANADPTPTITAPGQSIVGDSVQFYSYVVDPGRLDEDAGFTYYWDFGDGNTSHDRSPTHSYTAAGIYIVGLTVTDKDGGVGYVTKNVEVVSSGMASVGLTPGWATFGQVLPQGAAFDALQVGDLVTQTDVKNTWPDGSIKFAIVSANVPAAGNYVITDGSPPSGSFTPHTPEAEVRLNIGGILYTASLPATPSAETWLDGPLVQEWRQTITPLDPNGQPHDLLRVIIDARTYANGASRLDITLDNTLNLADATKVLYDVSIVADGQTVFERQSLEHWYMTRWRKTFNVGLTESEVVTDFEPFHEAGAIPRYRNDVDNIVTSPTGPSYDILGNGGISTNMNMGGEYERDGVLPWWVPRYITHRNTDVLDTIIAHGDLSGSWPIHLTMDNGSPPNVDELPKFWFDGRGGLWGTSGPAAGMSSENRGPLQPDAAHTPSLAYVPYVLTGDRYYADEMRSWGAFHASVNNPGYRGESDALLNEVQIRGMAWGLRNMAHAAAYLPDNDPFRDYFAEKVQNNLNWLDQESRTNTGPLGSIMHGKGSLTIGYNVSVWQYGYLNWSIENTNALGIPGVSGGQDTQRQMAEFALQFYSPDWPIEQATSLFGSGWAFVSERLPDGSHHYFTDLKSMRIFHESLNPDHEPYFWYAPHHVGLLQVAKRYNLPGAEAAYDWLLGIPDTLNFVRRSAGHAIVMK